MKFAIEFLGIIVTYILISTAILKIVLWAIKSIHEKFKTILLPFIYAILFGIGLLTSGRADPGFALPVPIFIIIILSFFTKINIITKIIIPILFWTTIIVLFNFFRSLQKNNHGKSE